MMIVRANSGDGGGVDDDVDGDVAPLLVVIVLLLI